MKCSYDAVRSQPFQRARWVSLCLLVSLTFAAQAGAQPLQRQIEKALASARLGDAHVGVSVQDPDTGETLASIDANTLFIPASNMKLLTSGAALMILGPDFHFDTELALAGQTLIVRGSGDPGLADPKLLDEMGMSVDSFLDAWVEAVVKSGVQSISELVADTRVFDRQAIHPSWPKEQLNRWYTAEVWGLNFHTNVVSVFATPRADGSAPSIRIEPEATWLSVHNLARSQKKGNTLWIARPPEKNELTLRGNVERDMIVPVEVTVHDSPDFLLRLLADRLEKAGLGRPKIRVADIDEALPQGDTLLVVRTSMETVLRRCNTNSYNLYAECLLKRMGHELTGEPGSWTSGGAALRMLIQQKLGATKATRMTIADGSGMSRSNRVTPALLTAWLAAMESDDAIRSAFLGSLPLAGETGTLRNRFKQRRPHHELRAKSGYLNGVSALSGYVNDPSSERALVFSVLVNDVPKNTPMIRVKRFQEEVALLADRLLDDLVVTAPTGSD